MKKYITLIFLLSITQVEASNISLPIQTTVNDIPVIVDLISNLHFGKVSLCETSVASTLTVSSNGTRTVSSGCLFLETDNEISPARFYLTGTPGSNVYLNKNRSTGSTGFSTSFTLSNGNSSTLANITFPNYTTLNSSGVAEVTMSNASISIPAKFQSGYYYGSFTLDIIY